MAINYLSSINLNQQELREAVIQKLATAPANGKLGQVYYDTGDDQIYVCVDEVAQTWNSIGGDITSVVAGNGLTGGGDSGEVTLNVGGGDAIEVSADSIAVLYGPGLRINQFNQLEVRVDDESIELDPTSQLSLKNTAVTAGEYGSSTEIPTFTVDADGRLTAAGTASISTTLNVAADSGSGDGVALATDTLTISGTANEIETSISGDIVTIGLPDDITVGNNLTVLGDLQVTGTTTTNNVETVSTSNGVIFEGTVADDNELSLIAGVLTADRTVTLPDASGTVALTSDINDATLTVEGSNGLSGSGTFTANDADNTTITLSHADTSSVSDVDNSGLTVIQDLTFDGFGHVQTVGSQDITSDVDARITAREYKTSIGDGAANTYTVTHNLNTRDVLVQLYDNSSYDTVFADVVRATVNTVEVSFGAAPALNDIRVLITKIG
jgi:hypothetical protein